MAAFSGWYQVSIFCWFGVEVGLLVRDIIRRTVRLRHDRGTRLMVSLSLGAAILLGWVLPGRVPALDIPAPKLLAAAGLVVLWLGLALRVWAVLVLGASFSTFVQVSGDQQVVTRGPYRWVRHPSYTGLLLIAVGFGIGAANWLSLVICAAVPLLGLVPRIALEEAELIRVLGDQYREYRTGTRRLIPGVW